MREIHNLEHADLDGWIILRSVFKKHDEARRVEDWIVLAQDRNKWRDVVNMEMNLWVPIKHGGFLD